ncbi:MAG: hypothetical protein K2Q25_01605, partial [Mycobacteriaceae bacterium]|nr:hypothetical protein [Mycobacteriaceae bacterium]
MRTHGAMRATEARTGVLVAAVLLLALNLRIGVTSASSLLETLVGEHVLDGTTALLLTAAPALIFGLASAPAAVCERRWGQNLTTSVAVILVAAGLAVRFIANPYLILVGTVVTCLGVAALNVVLPAVIQVHFPANTSAMTTAYTTMMALGAAGAAFVSVPIADLTGSASIALGIWALPALLAIIAWALAGPARMISGSATAQPTQSEPVASNPAYPAGTTLLVCFF